MMSSLICISPPLCSLHTTDVSVMQGTIFFFSLERQNSPLTILTGRSIRASIYILFTQNLDGVAVPRPTAQCTEGGEGGMEQQATISNHLFLTMTQKSNTYNHIAMLKIDMFFF